MPSASSDRRRVVGLLILLFAITYLDRVCISVAGPRIAFCYVYVYNFFQTSSALLR